MAELKLAKARQIWQLDFEGSWPTGVAFWDNNRLAVGNREGAIVVWDLPRTASGDEQAAAGDANKTAPSAPPNLPPASWLQGHTNAISRLVAAGDSLVSASLDGTVRQWSPDAPASKQTPLVLDSASREKQAKRLPSKDREAFLNRPGGLVDVVAQSNIVHRADCWIQALGVSRDQQRLVIGDDRAEVTVYDLAGGKQLAKWSGFAWNQVSSAALSGSGEVCLVCESTYKRDDFDLPAPAVRVWNAGSGELQLDILKKLAPKYDPQANSYGAAQQWRKLIRGGLIACDISPNGKLAAAGQGGETDTGKVLVIDMASGQLVREVAGHRYGVTDVKFSPDGQFLLSTGRDTTLQVCDVDSGKEVANLGTPRGGQFKDWLYALALSPDARRLAASDIGGKVHVWQLG